MKKCNCKARNPKIKIKNIPQMKDKIDNLIAYAIKEGFLDDSAEDWTDGQKIAYYQRCQYVDVD